ncbi:MAG: hypothetical protein F6K31_00945 [Symploca sp. SIO2G7]|nr:hypothetical protein [Symploca sp. SIO2G7]
MAYRDFTLSELVKTFNLKINQTNSLFAAFEELECSEYLKYNIKEYLAFVKGINTHEPNHKLITYSVLMEAKNRLKTQTSLFSEVNFNVDSEMGLNGICDFLVSLSAEKLISHPLINIVQSKSENLNLYLGQCIAQMLASQLFNDWENNEIKTIYGVVTNGTLWRFMKLVSQTVYIDSTAYHISYVNKILGILCSTISRTAFLIK